MSITTIIIFIYKIHLIKINPHNIAAIVVVFNSMCNWLIILKGVVTIFYSNLWCELSDLTMFNFVMKTIRLHYRVRL